MYGGLHRNLRLWRIRSIKVASKWRNEIHGNRKLSKRRYLSMFLVAGLNIDFITILCFLVLLIIVGKLLCAVGRFILSAIFAIALLIGLLALAGIV